MVMVVGAAAAAWYGVHWAKRRAMDRISAYTGGAMGRASQHVEGAPGRICTLLPGQDLERVLGVKIERAVEISEGSEAGCAYDAGAEAFAALRTAAVEQARKDSEQASKSPDLQKGDNPLLLLKHTKEMEGIVKTFALMNDAKENHVFSFTIGANGDENNWQAMRTALAPVPGFEELPGIGDHAIIGAFGHALYVWKGDKVITLQLTFVPEARTRGVELARIIASRL